MKTFDHKEYFGKGGSMINCKPYGTTMLRPDTCIARQTEMVELSKKAKEIKKRKKSSGLAEIRENSLPARYTDIMKCDGCQTGLELYQQFLEGETMATKEKRCSRKDCLKLLPATTEFFGSNKGTPDGLSYYCKECQSKVAKLSYQKKTGKVEPKQEVVKPEPIRKKIEPALMEETPISTKEAPIKNKFCKECGKDKPLTKEFWHNVTKYPGGWDYICSDCQCARKEKSRAREQLVIKLDFSEFPDSYKKLKTLAKSKLRPVEMQAVWAILTVLGDADAA